jgi:hypothetical protein
MQRFISETIKNKVRKGEGGGKLYSKSIRQFQQPCREGAANGLISRLFSTHYGFAYITEISPAFSPCSFKKTKLLSNYLLNYLVFAIFTSEDATGGLAEGPFLNVCRRRVTFPVNRPGKQGRPLRQPTGRGCTNQSAFIH